MPALCSGVQVESRKLGRGGSDGKVRFGSGSGYFCPNAEPEPRVRGSDTKQKILLKEVEALEKSHCGGTAQTAIRFWGAPVRQQTGALQTDKIVDGVHQAWVLAGSYGATVHEMGRRSRQLTAGLGGGTEKGYARSPFISEDQCYRHCQKRIRRRFYRHTEELGSYALFSWRAVNQ
ncbi:hypothetical protein B0H14DRAFT_2640131 [Mycena olivaceomarginata]|nr:hypothetical protein B0H14DRAFT_2640131 [Mycena olivaceomarginata]